MRRVYLLRQGLHGFGARDVGYDSRHFAARSLERCLEINDQMSKAYQLAGEALIEAGEKERAAGVLEKGYVLAAGRGDLMPKNAIAELLARIGREPPKVEEKAPGPPGPEQGAGAFICQQTGQPGTQLSEPPMRGAMGQWIHENISAETWSDWIGQGTKVINELRLDFSRDEDQHVFEQQMCEFLGLDPALYEKITGQPPAPP